MNERQKLLSLLSSIQAVSKALRAEAEGDIHKAVYNALRYVETTELTELPADQLARISQLTKALSEAIDAARAEDDGDGPGR